MDDLDVRDTSFGRQRAMTFDDLVQLKANGHLKTQRLRTLWRARNSAMTADERKAAKQRFNEKADKIASEFGKSRRLNLFDQNP